MPLFSGEDIEEGEEMQIVLDEDGQARSVQYIEEEDAEYPGGTMEVGIPLGSPLPATKYLSENLILDLVFF